MKNRVNSFKYAFQGIYYAFQTQANSRIHLGAAIIVVVLGIIFNISNFEWMMIVICIGAVISAELFNTAIETLSDQVTKAQKPEIRHIKDVAAGAVLITAIMAFVTGLIIFLPKISFVF